MTANEMKPRVIHEDELAGVRIIAVPRDGRYVFEAEELLTNHMGERVWTVGDGGPLETMHAAVDSLCERLLRKQLAGEVGHVDVELLAMLLYGIGSGVANPSDLHPVTLLSWRDELSDDERRRALNQASVFLKAHSKLIDNA